MDRCFWQQDDEYTHGIVREIRNGCVVVRWGEDVDCERARTNEEWVVASSFGEWHGVAGREDCVTDYGGCGGSIERRRVGEQDYGEFGDGSGGDE
jgi:hypothetical protein